TGRRIAQQLAAQSFNEEIRDEPTAVPSFVDDHGILIGLRIEALGEVLHTGNGSIGDVHVAAAASCSFVHPSAVSLDPIQVPQAHIVRDGPYHNRPRALGRRLVVDFKGDLFAGRGLEEPEQRFASRRWFAIYGNQVVAFVDDYAGLGEGGPASVSGVVARVYLLEAIISIARFKIRAE